MAWRTKQTGTGDEGYVLLSVESGIAVLRDEYIPVGYNTTARQVDADGNPVLDADGNEVFTTTFHCSGVVNVRCRVRETVTVEEWRGCTEASARALGADTLGGETVSDDRTGGVWRNGAAWCEVPCCIGTVTRVNARRANEAGGWTVTKTTTTTEKR